MTMFSRAAAKLRTVSDPRNRPRRPQDTAKDYLQDCDLDRDLIPAQTFTLQSSRRHPGMRRRKKHSTHSSDANADPPGRPRPCNPIINNHPAGSAPLLEREDPLSPQIPRRSCNTIASDPGGSTSVSSPSPSSARLQRRSLTQHYSLQTESTECLPQHPAATGLIPESMLSLHEFVTVQGDLSARTDVPRHSGPEPQQPIPGSPQSTQRASIPGPDDRSCHRFPRNSPGRRDASALESGSTPGRHGAHALSASPVSPSPSTTQRAVQDSPDKREPTRQSLPCVPGQPPIQRALQAAPSRKPTRPCHSLALCCSGSLSSNAKTWLKPEHNVAKTGESPACSAGLGPGKQSKIYEYLKIGGTNIMIEKCL